VRLMEFNQNKVTFELAFEFDKEGTMGLGQMFRILESMKERLSIVSYALNQTTLEQIFMKLANQHGAKSEF